MVNVNFHTVDETHFMNVQRAAILWIGKALTGMKSQNKDIASTLDYLYKKLRRSIDKFKPSGSFEDAIKNLTEVKQQLEHLKSKDWGDMPYKRCIYDGGDGSNYESGIYKDANVDNALDAIDELINIAKTESKKYH